MNKRNYKESDFCTDFSKWIRHQKYFPTCAIEFKVSDTDYIYFDRLEPHQLAALKAARYGNLYYKIPDDSRIQKPFDAFFLSDVEAYVTVLFRCKDRGQRFFFMVPVSVWEGESKKSKRLTKERAMEIGIKCELK